ncbi:MAG: T9SS type A sorting domain-containing protein, partial [Bacteroidia bacterium]|nr:T9SS type A sorting domain-containing protein [Bacteroidia bacterium]
LNGLNNRTTALTQTQWDLVLAGQESIGARENNIAVKNMLYRDINKLETNITRIYLEDITDPTSSDNAYNRLLQRTDRSAKYLAAYSSLERQNLSLCNSIMSEIYQTLETSEEFYIHQNMVDLITITSDYFSGNDYTFPSTNQVALLTTLVDNGDYPGLIAKNILLEFGQINYSEPIVESSMLKNAIIEWEPIIASSLEEEILVYPNPANEVINLELPELGANASFELWNQMGQRIMSGQIDSNICHHSLDIQELIPGMYNLIILKNNNKVFSKIITVQ